MDWTARPSQEVKTLAANILVGFLPGRYQSESWDKEYRCKIAAGVLADQLAQQILVTLPLEGGVLEADFLQDWINRHLSYLWSHGYFARLRRSQQPVSYGLPNGPWYEPGKVLK